MPKLNIIAKSPSSNKAVAELYRCLREGARADSVRGEQASWRQFRAGMAMCIG